MSIKNIFFLAASAAVCIGLLAAPAEARFKVTASKGSPDLPNVPCNEELGGTVYFDDAQKVMFYCRGREVTGPLLNKYKVGWVPLGYPEQIVHEKGVNAGQRLTDICLFTGCEVNALEGNIVSLPTVGEMVEGEGGHGHLLANELDVQYKLSLSSKYNPYEKSPLTYMGERQVGYNPAPGSYKQPYPVYLDVNGDGRADQADRAGGEEGELRFFDGLRSPDHNRNALQNQRTEGEMAYWDGEGWVKISNNDWIINRNWDGKLDTFDAPKHHANSDSPRFTSCSGAILFDFEDTDAVVVKPPVRNHTHDIQPTLDYVYLCTATPPLPKPISGVCNEQVKGEMFYNPARAILEYCSGTQWIPVKTELYYVLNLVYVVTASKTFPPAMDGTSSTLTIQSTIASVETAVAPLANAFEGRYWVKDCNGDPDNPPLDFTAIEILDITNDENYDASLALEIGAAFTDENGRVLMPLPHVHAFNFSACERAGNSINLAGTSGNVSPSQNTSLTWEKCKQIPIATRPVGCDLLEP